MLTERGTPTSPTGVFFILLLRAQGEILQGSEALTSACHHAPGTDLPSEQAQTHTLQTNLFRKKAIKRL